MSTSGSGPFREKSLERLSSPERLDQLLSVVDRKSWLPLITLCVIVVVLVVWSVLGSIPENVEGRGILTRPRDIVQLHSPAAGQVRELPVFTGEHVAAGSVIAVIARPEIEKRLEGERLRLQQLQAKAREAWESHAPGAGGSDDLETGRELSRELRETELEMVAEERRRLEEQRRVAKELQDSLYDRKQGLQELLDDKIVSRADVEEAESNYMDAMTRVATLDSELRSLRSRELEIEEEHLGRVERIGDRAQEIADVEREIERLEHLRQQESDVRSKHEGRLVELGVAEGEFVAAGARLGSMTTSDPTEPLTAVAYFTVRDGKRREEGDEIRITPDTVERQRFGSIRGKVRSISLFSVTLDEAEKNIGNPVLAETLVSTGYDIQVFADLERDPDTFSGLAWTSSRGPEMQFSTGTTTSARVAVDHRPPISFVLPFLKSAAGIE